MPAYLTMNRNLHRYKIGNQRVFFFYTSEQKNNRKMLSNFFSQFVRIDYWGMFVLISNLQKFFKFSHFISIWNNNVKQAVSFWSGLLCRKGKQAGWSRHILQNHRPPAVLVDWTHFRISVAFFFALFCFPVCGTSFFYFYFLLVGLLVSCG